MAPRSQSALLWSARALALAGVAMAFAVIDYATGPELSTSVFYVIPIAYAAARHGRTAALTMAAWCVALWLSVDWMERQHSHRIVHVWNALVRGAFFVTIAHYVARNSALVEKLEGLARRDGLTGIANALAFRDALVEEIARGRRTSRPFALAYIDLDNFKQVNDQQGHHAGDRLLREVAQLMHRRVRQTDVVARLGGDEFAILFREGDRKGFETAATDVHRRLGEHLRRYHAGVHASIGVVCFAEPPNDADEAVRAADALMYEVKRAGKAAVRISDAPEPRAAEQPIASRGA